MLLSDIMACGSQCYQRQCRRQGTKLDRYWGITKHRKERSLRGRMLLVTLQHGLTSTLDSGVQTDMIVLEFSKAFDRVPKFQTFSLPGKLHHDGIRGYPTVDQNTSFFGRTQCGCWELFFRKCARFQGGGGGGPVCVSTGALAISAIYSVHLYVPDTTNTSRRVFTITLHWVRSEMAMNF